MDMIIIHMILLFNDIPLVVKGHVGIFKGDAIFGHEWLFTLNPSLSRSYHHNSFEANG